MCTGPCIIQYWVNEHQYRLHVRQRHIFIVQHLFFLWRLSHWHLFRWRVGLVSVATIEKLCHELDLPGTEVQHIFGSFPFPSTSPCHLSHPNPLPSFSPPYVKLVQNVRCQMGVSWNVDRITHTHTHMLQLHPSLWCSSAPPDWIRHITALSDTSIKKNISFYSSPLSAVLITGLWI